MSVEIMIAYAGVFVSSLLAALGLILNYRVVRRSNRLTVSSRLSELTQLLSDEMKALSELRALYRKQIDTPDNVLKPKNESPQDKLVEVEKRQSEISNQLEAITLCFVDLDAVDPADVDSMICKAILNRGLYEHAIDYAKRVKLAI